MKICEHVKHWLGPKITWPWLVDGLDKVDKAKAEARRSHRLVQVARDRPRLS